MASTRRQAKRLFELLPRAESHASQPFSTLCGCILADPNHRPKSLQQANTYLPCIDRQHLNNSAQLAHFITRVLDFSEWQQFQLHNAGDTFLTGKALIDIHARYKYLVMAHSLDHYKSLGRLLSNLRGRDLTNIANEYFQRLMAALAIPATRKTHSNTLMHIQGYLKNVLNSEEKAELTDLIHQYRNDLAPLRAPLNLLKQHFMQQPDMMNYILEQVYLNPHPLVIDSAS